MNVQEIIKKLKEPFPKEVVHWRVGAANQDKSKGIALAYVDARDVMKRLDDVVGPENWQNRYPYAGCCEIGIRISSDYDDWIWKSDGAGETNVEGEKGQYSDAFKRAAVRWGIGRYLYYLDAPWVDLDERRRIKNPPALPKWALPGYSPAMEKKVKIEAVEQITEAIRACDEEGLKEIMSDFNPDETAYLWREFSSAQRGTIKEMLK